MSDSKKDQKTIVWTRPMLERFKQAYQACQGDRFTFDGNEFLKAYAKYLIEYLETRLKSP